MRIILQGLHAVCLPDWRIWNLSDLSESLGLSAPSPFFAMVTLIRMWLRLDACGLDLAQRWVNCDFALWSSLMCWTECLTTGAAYYHYISLANSLGGVRRKQKILKMLRWRHVHKMLLNYRMSCPNLQWFFGYLVLLLYVWYCRVLFLVKQ